MTECKPNQAQKSSMQLEFPFLKSCQVTVDFEGGDTTSDAGWVFIRQEDERQGLCEAIAAAIHDRRDPRRIHHEMLALIRQRVYQIAAGYEDCNDASELRVDSALKAAAAGRRPQDDPLASQPTLSRLENRTEEWELERIMEAFVQNYMQQRGAPPDYLILDIDATDDACHGQQQLAFWHGFYAENIYLPLVVFDGESGDLIMPVLRPGNVHGASGLDLVLSWLLNRLREVWPETEIIICGDGGMASPRLYKLAEEEGVWYVIGLVTNDLLRSKNWRALAAARMRRECEGRKVRVFSQFAYQAGSWDIPRRVIGKAEVLDLGENQRFVVTNLREGTPEAIYRFYCARGERAENRIKEWKTMMHADRLSCHEFYPNWFRMLLYSAAYQLLLGLRKNLAGTEFECASMDTLRLKLIKVGARIKSTVRRLWIHCAGGYPYKHIWAHLHRRLCPA
jgi:hypothetical protein